MSVNYAGVAKGEQLSEECVQGAEIWNELELLIEQLFSFVHH